MLSAKKRERLAPLITSLALDWSYGQTSPAEINRYGIVKATHMAMRRAIRALRRVDFVLVDAFYIPYLRNLRRKNQLAIIKGDKKCLSIAAASILAKVKRDSLLIALGKKFPQYHLQNHKGYGTAFHCMAIQKHGTMPFHRRAFVTKILAKKKILTKR